MGIAAYCIGDFNMGIAKALIADETAATGIEYGLLASFLAMTLLGGFQVLANQVDDSFADVSEQYEDAQ